MLTVYVDPEVVNIAEGCAQVDLEIVQCCHLRIALQKRSATRFSLLLAWGATCVFEQLLEMLVLHSA